MRARGAHDKRQLLRRTAGAAWRRLKGGELTPRRAALSIALGLAIGVTPLWGLHWLIVVAVCVPFRLDAPLAYIAANVSLPFVAPFITFAELEIGARVIRGAWLALTPEQARHIDIATMLVEGVVGTVFLAVGFAAVGGLLTYAFVAWRRAARAAPR
ncbi:MAG: DUF2062 domain-containing protein [Polyangiaceae bacterium]|nr:DUF2062 domain-containing protein [Polyangiaceae bacterium]